MDTGAKMEHFETPILGEGGVAAGRGRCFAGRYTQARRDPLPDRQANVAFRVYHFNEGLMAMRVCAGPFSSSRLEGIFREGERIRRLVTGRSGLGIVR